MGGFGSTRWNDHLRALTVEDCLPLRCARLKEAGAFGAGAGTSVQLHARLEGFPIPGVQSVRRETDLL